VREWDSGLQCGEVPRLALPATPRQQQHSSPQLDCQVHRERRSSPPLSLSSSLTQLFLSFRSASLSLSQLLSVEIYLSPPLSLNSSFLSAPRLSQLLSDTGRAPPPHTHTHTHTHTLSPGALTPHTHSLASTHTPGTGLPPFPRAPPLCQMGGCLRERWPADRQASSFITPPASAPTLKSSLQLGRSF